VTTTPTAEHRRLAALVTTLIATAMFAAALGLRTRIDPFASTGIAACVAIPLALRTLGRARLARLFTATWRQVALASALGIGLVLVTHAVFAVMPSTVRREILTLYISIEGDIPTPLLAAITAAVVLTEELVWRGTALELLGPRYTSRIAAAALALMLYVVPQLVGGEWILVLAAVGLGGLSSWLRLATGGLVAPLVTHATWSIAIFVLVPLGP
jgi:uncharacterized protein